MKIERKIRKYIKSHKNSSLKDKPLIFFTIDAVNICKTILVNEYNISDCDIKCIEENNVIVSCKHFPYTCDEVPNEHVKSEFCECRGIRMCDQHTPNYRSYLEFYDIENKFMEHNNNCYDDCCCFQKVFTRFSIIVNY